ncbi:MAG TPA: tyrosinase family protein [Pyrinomonadaceae bacterium]|nr:tyrosinase family protein [Pyrinomonadaceae bacterium]
MSKFPRRTFIAGLSTIPFALWFEKYAAAQTRAHIRYNVTSVNGLKMLNIYRGTVGTMMSTAEPNPIGWLFQWYTHNVRGDRTKAAELARVYPAPSAQKTLATAMWNTCQAHHAGDVEDYFLPWHRMYVYFLERIIRKVSGHAEFTLPYWNYSNPAVPSGPRVPKAFRAPAAATNPLYRPQRNAGANAGSPIDASDPGALDLTALAECTYSPSGVHPGFNSDLDGGLHGSVHVLVGNASRGMGSIPWAANDPIFWMHHCNIDRLWESWNRAGRLNPTTASWLTHQFVFADENGNQVIGTIQDFKRVAPLKYAYDHYEPVPACPAAKMGPEAAAEPQQTRAIAPAGAVELSGAPVQVNFEAPPGPEAEQLPLSQRIKQLKTGRRLYVVARNLRADVQPGVLYHVYFDLPAGTTPKPGKRDPHYVGTLNFFDAHDHEGGAEAAGTAKFRSFDVTRVAKNLQATKRLSTKPGLTIAPANQPEADAKPVVGEITVVEQ